MRFSARIFGFLLAFLLLSFITTTSFAQNTNYVPQETSQKVPSNLNTYAQKVLIEVVSAMGCQLTGINPTNQSQPCLEANPKTGEIGFTQNKGGLLGFTGNMIAVLYTPPAHTSDYVRYVAGNFGIAKEANAQNVGVGLTSIGPIGSLWVTFRNIVYLLFVVVFTIIGFGIMLRVKIDPRTVMTIQNQIPKIVIGLILVTLSFAIAGFLIDLMWVVIIVIANVFIGADPGLHVANGTYVTPFSMSDVAGGALGIARDTATVIGGSIFNTGFTGERVNDIVQLPTGGDCGFPFINCIVGDIIGGIVGSLLGFILGIVVGIFAFFVVAIAILWALFKIWFALIRAYISILIDIIFAPFWIIAGLIPSGGEKQTLGFGAWIRDMLGNLMVFPVAITMFFLAGFFTRQYENTQDVFFAPPLVGDISTEFGAIIAFGIIMAIPEAIKKVKEAFKSGGAELGIGKGVQTGINVAMAPVGGAWKNLTRRPEYSGGRVIVQEGVLRNKFNKATAPIKRRLTARGAPPPDSNPENLGEDNTRSGS